ncbi:DUF4157 domain-containing protein [Rhodanobacter glycinis]|nr:DUF4157 domain-containing protein [Rhodanobacter glycinis]
MTEPSTSLSMKPAPSASVRGLRLQRKCACGTHTPDGGECAECSKRKRADVQTKLRVNAAGDIYEQEADRIADRVMVVPGHQMPIQAPLGIQRFSRQSDERGDAAPASVDHALADPGRPLEPVLRHGMEQRFGHDFSGVRVHSDQLAARSADDVHANAYTVGSHIVFGAGKFDPGNAKGTRLLAHELTHVVQQGGAGRLSLQRDEKKDKAKSSDAQQQPAPVTPDPATAYFHIVVRDAGLDLGGGVLVSDLAAAKTRLMQRRIDKPWTLVLAIHASENRLGAQAPPDWQKNAVFYDEAAIKSLFGGDSAFVGWRDQFGPNRVVLYGCQVTAAFEQTIADNLARGGKAPTASGLGEGCKPQATSVTFGVESRRVYDTLTDNDKQDVLAKAQAANDTWGYYGGPPVPRDQVLDYLFKGPKPGWWPKVEVIVKQGDQYVSANPPIPYWNRLSNSTFLRMCTKAVGNLREHTPQAPTMREGE